MDEQETIDFQDKCRRFWDDQNAWCQTSLVEELFKKEIDGFDLDSVQNLYYTNEDELEDEDEDDQCQEVLEWWLIDNRLSRFLSEQHQPILENDFGIWWGRCTSGQAVYADSVIEDIVMDIEKYMNELRNKQEMRK